MSAPAGLDKMLAKLKAAPGKAREGLKGQFAADSSTIVAEMKARAPDDTGKLRASIKSVPRKGGVGVRITAGGPTTTKTGHKGRPYDYARATEFGTRKEPARPFFYPVLRAAKSRLKRNATNVVKKAIDT